MGGADFQSLIKIHCSFVYRFLRRLFPFCNHYHCELLYHHDSFIAYKPAQATGQCLTLWMVSFLYSFSVLIVLPVQNGQLSTIIALYAEAELSFANLLVEGSRLLQTPERQQIMTELAAADFQTPGTDSPG
jgi:hypothetical protein